MGDEEKIGVDKRIASEARGKIEWTRYYNNSREARWSLSAASRKPN